MGTLRSSKRNVEWCVFIVARCTNCEFSFRLALCFQVFQGVLRKLIRFILPQGELRVFTLLEPRETSCAFLHTFGEGSKTVLQAFGRFAVR